MTLTKYTIVDPFHGTGAHDYYLAADVEALFVDRSEWGQERDRLTARITELERYIEGCQRSNAGLFLTLQSGVWSSQKGQR